MHLICELKLADKGVIVNSMEYISVVQFAEKYGISERTARNYCAGGKIDGAFLTGKTWNIPADAEFPKDEEEILPPAELLADYFKKRKALDHEIDKTLAEIQRILGIEINLQD